VASWNNSKWDPRFILTASLVRKDYIFDVHKRETIGTVLGRTRTKLFLSARQLERRFSMPPSSSSRRHTLTHGISTPNFLAELPPQYTVDAESPQNPAARRRLSHPPRYSNAIALELQRQGSSSGQDSTCQHQHEFHIMNANRSHAWTTLRIFSRNAGSTPQFFGRDFIAGSVELDLEKPQKINSITLYVSNIFLSFPR
jgi:hypothetical protein